MSYRARATAWLLLGTLCSVLLLSGCPQPAPKPPPRPEPAPPKPPPPAATAAPAAKRAPVAAKGGPVGRMQAALAVAVNQNPDWKEF